VWWLANDQHLPSQAAAIIGDYNTEVVVSAASAWEISIKQAAGRLEAPDDVLDAVAANDFEALAITAAHAVAAGRLPPHHADPFDRMLRLVARSGPCAPRVTGDLITGEGRRACMEAKASIVEELLAIARRDFAS
jgi:PIN domain nuclease of toxin-antitoxin system